MSVYNAAKLADAMIDALTEIHMKELDFDHADMKAVGDKDKATFHLTKYHDQKIGPRDRDIKPLGMVTYEIAITARYHRVEGDDE